MKIVYVVPGIMDKQEKERRENLLKSWASSDAEVSLTDVTEGPASIESMYEEYLSIPITTKKMFQLEEEGYDAAILGCAGDPGLDGMREITNKMLVIGPGQSSMQVAVMLGNRFSVISVTDSTVAHSYEQAQKAGVPDRLASVKALNIPVLEIANDKQKTVNKIIDLGKEAVKNDRADVIILGCMSMGFLDVSEEIQKELEIPVINPSKIGLKVAEALAGAKLLHSKKAFMTPPKLASGKVNNLEDLYERTGF